MADGRICSVTVGRYNRDSLGHKAVLLVCSLNIHPRRLSILTILVSTTIFNNGQLQAAAENTYHSLPSIMTLTPSP